MSDEIVDVTSEYVENIPEETITKEGMNIPDPSLVENISEEGIKKIEERRLEVSNLPEFPKEWQQGYVEEDNGFESKSQIPVTATIKQDEINKLIKKYKRYMKSNIREIRRVENDVES